MKTKVKEIYVPVDGKGTSFDECARLTHDAARNAFVRSWLSPIQQHVDDHTCWNIWNCFERAGYKMLRIETKNL